MTTGGNAEAAIVIRAVNEASEELEQIQRDTDDTSESLFGFSRNAVGAGIAALGLSFGLKEALEAGGAAVEVNAQTDAILRLLGPEVEEAFRNLEPMFGDIATEVVALASEVERAGLIITQNSGGIVPSVDELKFAFDLAAAAGTDYATAAAAVGQALQGNLAPLNELLDPSGRSYIGLNDAMRDLSGTSSEASSGLARVANTLGRIAEALGQSIDGPLGRYAEMLDMFAFVLVPAVVDALGRFFGAIGEYAAVIPRLGADLGGGLWKAFDETFIQPITRFFTELLPSLIEGVGGGIGDLFGGIGDFFGIGNTGGEGSSTVQVVINGNVDSPERAAEFARQVNRQLRETNRRGVNVSA